MESPGEIRSRIYLPGDITEIVFVRDGILRLGRMFPASVDEGTVSSLISYLGRHHPPGVLFPDSFRMLAEDRVCMSLPVGSPPRKSPSPAPLSEVLKRLRALSSLGECCLGLDRNSLVELEGELRLVVWNEALLGLHGGLPPEVSAGGYAGVWSTAYVLGELIAAGALFSDQDVPPVDHVELLCSPIPSKRAHVAEALGLPSWPVPGGCRKLPGHGFSVLDGGDWRLRDSAVNELTGLALSRGMRVRVIRCSSRESHRPLPDVPPDGKPVLSPGDLMRRVFGPSSDMDRLLIIDDAQRASPDLKALLEQLAVLPPPGLRVVISSPAPPDFITHPCRTIQLDGDPSDADDFVLDEVDAGLEDSGPPGPSWYGPRIRCLSGKVHPGGQDHDMIELHSIGADRTVAFLAEGLSPDHRDALPAASSLIRLGRWREALELLPEGFPMLRGQAMLGIGRARDAVPLLRRAFEETGSDDSRCLLARALIAADLAGEAEDLLRESISVRSTVILTDLLDSLGRPAEAIGPLRRAEGSTPGREPVPILCAQARIYMRLGRYREALESTDRAVVMAGTSEQENMLEESLLTRGRVREVIGEWDKALDDYRIAVSLFEAVSGAGYRPPHVDLFVLLLRTGHLMQADEVWSRLVTAMTTPSNRPRRMELMLLAYRFALLGAGDRGVPIARRATELAALEHNPLHQALCTLYTGVLTVQAGGRRVGIDLIRRARSWANLLSDRHLLLMCDLELLSAGEEDIQEDLHMSAEELGMVPEALRASFLQKGDIKALEDLLDLPAPLEALAAASCGRTALPPGLLHRLRKTMEKLAGQLPPEDASSLLQLYGGISSSPEHSRSSLDTVLSEVSRWSRRRLSDGAPLQELAQALGIDKLDTRRSDICFAALSEDPPLYASAAVPGLEKAAALLAALVSSTTEEKAGAAGESSDYPELIGESTAMMKLRSSLDRTVTSSVPVLLLGETGTGKELAAKGIHRRRNTKGAFVPVDCGAIPSELLESALFGAKRGAYTGLQEDRKGLIEEARGGTLFLDEIGNLPEHLQVKLLRVLDTGRFRRLGENREQECCFNLLAATNMNLQSAVTRGSFRDDLYYRIAVMIIEMPPLRERREDIPVLARHFLDRIPGGLKIEITSGAIRALEAHSWPGNVRELSNVIQRAVALSGDGNIKSRHILTDDLNRIQKKHRLETIRLATSRHVYQVVSQLEGNRISAAEILDCDPKTVRKYMRIYEDEC